MVAAREQGMVVLWLRVGSRGVGGCALVGWRVDAAVSVVVGAAVRLACGPGVG